MVNHLRTLLLNLPAAAVPGENEEFIESTFMPRQLSAEQAAFRAVVFPAEFPRAYQNFIATVLTRLAYQSPFRSNLQDLDRRLILEPVELQAFAPANVVTPLPLSTLQVVGQFTPRIDLGLFSNHWSLSYVSPTSITISDANASFTQTVPVIFTGDTSAPIKLEATSALSIQFVGVSQVPSNLLVELRASAPMTYNMVNLVERMHTSRSCNSLIGRLLDPYPALQKQLYDAFQRSNERPDIGVAAALVAYAYSFETEG